MSEPDLIDDSALRGLWPLPEPDADGSKHDRGTVVVIGGAAATPGAVLLAGLAALRVGAGRLSIGTTTGNAPSLAVAIPEAAVAGMPTTGSGELGRTAVPVAADLINAADSVLIGPGMAGPTSALELTLGLLPHVAPNATVVLDALALTCGVTDHTSMKELASRMVITPNRSEAAHLIDLADGASDGAAAKLIATRFDVVTILGSTVAAPDGQAWSTRRGNPGLATSGSGDVLAGVVAGLAARGASPLGAALWAVSLHSGAGDRLARRIAPLGFLARELLEELPGIMAGPRQG